MSGHSPQRLQLSVGLLLLLLLRPAVRVLCCDSVVCITSCTQSFSATTPNLLETDSVTYTYTNSDGWNFAFIAIMVDGYDNGRDCDLTGGSLPAVDVAGGQHEAAIKLCLENNGQYVCATCTAQTVQVTAAGSPWGFYISSAASPGNQVLTVDVVTPSTELGAWGGVGPTWEGSTQLSCNEAGYPNNEYSAGYWCEPYDSYWEVQVATSQGVAQWLYFSSYYSDTYSGAFSETFSQVCPGYVTLQLCVYSDCTSYEPVCNGLTTTVLGLPPAVGLQSVTFDVFGDQELVLSGNDLSSYDPSLWQLQLMVWVQSPYDDGQFVALPGVSSYTQNGTSTLSVVSVFTWFYSAIEAFIVLGSDEPYFVQLQLASLGYNCEGMYIPAEGYAYVYIPLPPVLVLCAASPLHTPNANECAMSQLLQSGPPQPVYPTPAWGLPQSPTSDWVVVYGQFPITLSYWLDVEQVRVTLVSQSTGAELSFLFGMDELLVTGFEEGFCGGGLCFEVTVSGVPVLDWYAVSIVYAVSGANSTQWSQPGPAYFTVPPPPGPVLDSVSMDSSGVLVFSLSPSEDSPQLNTQWDLLCGVYDSGRRQLEYCGPFAYADTFNDLSDVSNVTCPDWFQSVMAPYVIGRYAQFSCSLFLPPCDTAGECQAFIPGSNNVSDYYGLFPPPQLCLQPPLRDDWPYLALNDPAYHQVKVDFQLPLSPFFSYSVDSYSLTLTAASTGQQYALPVPAAELNLTQQYILTQPLPNDTYTASFNFTAQAVPSLTADTGPTVLPFACLACFGVSGYCPCASCPIASINSSDCVAGDGFASFLPPAVAASLSTDFAAASTVVSLGPIPAGAALQVNGSVLGPLQLSMPWTLAMRVRLNTLYVLMSNASLPVQEESFVLPLLTVTWQGVGTDPYEPVMTVKYASAAATGNVSLLTVTFPAADGAVPVTVSAAVELSSSEWTVLGVAYSSNWWDSEWSFNSLCLYADERLLQDCANIDAATSAFEYVISGLYAPGPFPPASWLAGHPTVSVGGPPSDQSSVGLDVDSVHLFDVYLDWSDAYDSLYSPQHAPQFMPASNAYFGSSFPLGVVSLSAAAMFGIHGVVSPFCSYPAFADYWAPAAGQDVLSNSESMPLSFQDGAAASDSTTGLLSPFLLPGFTLLANRLWYSQEPPVVSQAHYTVTAVEPPPPPASLASAVANLLTSCSRFCYTGVPLSSGASVCHSFVAGMDAQYNGVCWLRAVWAPEEDLPIVAYPTAATSPPQANALDVLDGAALFYHMWLFDSFPTVPLYQTFPHQTLLPQSEWLPQLSQAPEAAVAAESMLPAVGDRFGCAYYCAFNLSSYCVGFSWTRYGECQLYSGPWPTLSNTTANGTWGGRYTAYVNSWTMPDPCTDCIQAQVTDCPSCMSSSLFRTELPQLTLVNGDGSLYLLPAPMPDPSSCLILPSALTSSPTTRVTLQSCVRLCQQYQAEQGFPYSCTAVTLSQAQSSCFLLVNGALCEEYAAAIAVAMELRPSCNGTSYGSDDCTRTTAVTTVPTYAVDGVLYTDWIVLPNIGYQLSLGAAEPSLPDLLSFALPAVVEYDVCSLLAGKTSILREASQCQSDCLLSESCVAAVSSTTSMDCWLLHDGELGAYNSSDVLWTLNADCFVQVAAPACPYGSWPDTSTGTCRLCSPGTYFDPRIIGFSFNSSLSAITGDEWNFCQPCTNCAACESCDSFTGACLQMSDQCLINSTCWQDGELNPFPELSIAGLDEPALLDVAPCESCQPASNRDSWSYTEAACNDGRLCTYNDSCSEGFCHGTAYSCAERYGSCMACNGLGGCILQADACLTNGTAEGSTCGCLSLDASGQRQCIAWNQTRPDSGGCAVSGLLLGSSDGEPGVENDLPLYMCPWNTSSNSSEWAPAYERSCDDGDLCTYHDRCSSSLTCEGVPGMQCSDRVCAVNSTCDGMGGCNNSTWYNASDHHVCQQAGQGDACAPEIECDGTEATCPVRPLLLTHVPDTAVMRLAFPDYQPMSAPLEDGDGSVLQYPSAIAVYVNVSGITVPCGGLSYRVGLFNQSAQPGGVIAGCPALADVIWQPDGVLSSSFVQPSGAALLFNDTLAARFDFSLQPLSPKPAAYDIVIAAWDYHNNASFQRCLNATFAVDTVVPSAEASFALQSLFGCCWPDTTLQLLQPYCFNASQTLVAVRLSNETGCSWSNVDNVVESDCPLLVPPTLLQTDQSTITVPPEAASSSVVATLICKADNSLIASVDSQSLSLDPTPPVISLTPLTATSNAGVVNGSLVMAQTLTSQVSFNLSVLDSESGINQLLWCLGPAAGECQYAAYAAVPPFNSTEQSTTLHVPAVSAVLQQLGLAAQPGQHYVVTVEAVNRAGHTGIVSSIPLVIVSPVNSAGAMWTGPVRDGSGLRGVLQADYALFYPTASLAQLDLLPVTTAEGAGNDSLSCNWPLSPTAPFQWMDAIGGVALYQLQFSQSLKVNGVYQPETVVLPWQNFTEFNGNSSSAQLVSALFNVSTASGFAASELQLEARYVCYLRYVNLAGVVSEQKSSTGVTFVSLPPDSGLVWDVLPGSGEEAQTDVQGYYNVTAVAVGLGGQSFVPQPPELTPIAYYVWHVGTAPGLADVLNLTSNSSQLPLPWSAPWPPELDALLEELPRVYSTFIAVNRAGLYSSNVSDGVTLTLGEIPLLLRVDDGNGSYYSDVFQLPSSYGISERQCLQISSADSVPDDTNVTIALQLCASQSGLCLQSEPIVVSLRSASAADAPNDTLPSGLLLVLQQTLQDVASAVLLGNASNESVVVALHRQSSESAQLPFPSASAPLDEYCFDFAPSLGDVSPLVLIVSVASSLGGFAYAVEQSAAYVDPFFAVYTAVEGLAAVAPPSVQFESTASAEWSVADFAWLSPVDPGYNATAAFSGSSDLDYSTDATTVQASWAALPNVAYYDVSFGHACGDVSLCAGALLFYNWSSSSITQPLPPDCVLSPGAPLFVTVAAVSIFRGPLTAEQLHYSLACSDGVYLSPAAQSVDSSAPESVALTFEPPPLPSSALSEGVTYLAWVSSLAVSWQPFSFDYTYSIANGTIVASILVQTDWCLGSAPQLCDGLGWQSGVPDDSWSQQWSDEWWYLGVLPGLQQTEPQLLALELQDDFTLSQPAFRIPDGVWYVSLRSWTRARQLLFAASSPFILDSSGLTAGQVAIGPTSAFAQTSQPQQDRLWATWSNFTDAASGVLSFSWAVGSQPGWTDVLPWTDVGTAPFASAAGLQLSACQWYYVQVSAESYVGSVATAGAAVNIDPLQPWPGLAFVVTGALYVSGPFDSWAWSINRTFVACSDFPSSQLLSVVSLVLEGWSDDCGWIAGFSFAVGSTPLGQQLQSWQTLTLPPSNTVLYDGATYSSIPLWLPLTSGSTYWITVMATDAAGNSQTSSSLPFVADSTPPTVDSALLNGGSSALSSVLVDVTLMNAADPESGIASITAIVWVDGAAGSTQLSLGPFPGAANDSLQLDVSTWAAVSGALVTVEVSVWNGAGLSTNLTWPALVLNLYGAYASNPVECLSGISVAYGSCVVSISLDYNASSGLFVATSPIAFSFAWSNLSDAVAIASYEYSLSAYGSETPWLPPTTLNAAVALASPQLMPSAAFGLPSYLVQSADDPSLDASYVRVDFSVLPDPEALTAAASVYSGYWINVLFSLIVTDVTGWSSQYGQYALLQWNAPSAGNISAVSTSQSWLPVLYTAPDSQLGAPLQLFLYWDGFGDYVGYELSVGTTAGLDDIFAWLNVGTNTSAALLLSGLDGSLSARPTLSVNVSASGLSSNSSSSSSLAWDLYSDSVWYVNVRALDSSGLPSPSAASPLYLVHEPAVAGTALLQQDGELITAVFSGWTAASEQVPLLQTEVALLKMDSTAAANATAMHLCVALAASIPSLPGLSQWNADTGCFFYLSATANVAAEENTTQWDASYVNDEYAATYCLLALVTWVDPLFSVSAVSAPLWVDTVAPELSGIDVLSTTGAWTEDGYTLFQTVDAAVITAVSGLPVVIAASWSPAYQPWTGVGWCEAQLSLFQSSNPEPMSVQTISVPEYSSGFNTTVLVVANRSSASPSLLLLSPASYSLALTCSSLSGVTAYSGSVSVLFDASPPLAGLVTNLGYTVQVGQETEAAALYLQLQTELLQQSAGGCSYYSYDYSYSTDYEYSLQPYAWMPLSSGQLESMQEVSWLSSASLVAVSWSGFQAVGSDIAYYELSIGSSAGGVQLLDWMEVWGDAAAFLLPFGSDAASAALLQACGRSQPFSVGDVTQLFVNIRAVAASGLTAVASSSPLSIDDGPLLPIGAVQLNGGQQYLTSTTDIAVSWAAYGSISPVVAYQVQLYLLCNPIIAGSCDGGAGDAGSSLVPADLYDDPDVVMDSWVTLAGNSTGLDYVFPFSQLFTSSVLQDGARLRALLRVWNAAGTIALQLSNVVTLVFVPPVAFTVSVVPTSAVAVTADGSSPVYYQLLPVNASDSLTIATSWSGFTDSAALIVAYNWSIGSAPGLADWLPWQQCSDEHQESAVIDGAQLQELIAQQQQQMPAYYISLQAIDAVGFSAIASSSAVWLDDGQSLLPGLVTVSPSAWPALAPPLSPPVPAVFAVLQSSPTAVKVSWTAFAAPHAPLAGYSVAIGLLPYGEQVLPYGAVMAAQQLQVDLSSPSFVAVPIAMVADALYYVSVRAVTQLGEEAFATATLLVDETAPPTAVASLVDGDATSCTAEVPYQSGAVSLVCWQSAALFDPESFIAALYVGLSAQPNSLDLSFQSWLPVELDWIYALPAQVAANLSAASGPGLSPAAVDWSAALQDSGRAADWSSLPVTRPAGVMSYAVLMAINGVGLSSFLYSPGSLWDNTQPQPLSPYSVWDTRPLQAQQLQGMTADIDCIQPSGAGGQAEASLAAQWLEMTDPESGVAEYSFAVSTFDTASAQFVYAFNWTSAGLNVTATTPPLALTVGQAYYWLLRATNPSQLSTVAASDGITVLLPSAAGTPAACIAVLPATGLSVLTQLQSLSSPPAVLPP